MTQPIYNKKSSISIFQKRWESSSDVLMRRVLGKFSLIERLFFFLVLLIFIFSGLSIFWQVNRAFLVQVPATGGSFTEGVIGTPRAINPLLASESSDADKDLSMLIYSGLLKATSDGGLIHDLAKSYRISENGLVYTFILKDNIYFHDGKPVTTADVEFTVHKAQDQLIKSPKRISWEGVQVEVVNDKEIKFILPAPYSPFLQNTTLGILPKHLWKDLDPDQFTSSLLNLEPIGSGPYKVSSIKRGSNGLPVSYRLRAFSKYALGEPNIHTLYLKFFFNEADLIAAFERKQIESLGGIPPKLALSLKGESDLKTGRLSRIFGIFFNHNQAALFTHEEVRKALDLALDKKELVHEVLAGYGTPLASPVPPPYSILNKKTNEESDPAMKLAEARVLLEKGGWQFDEAEQVWKKKNKNTEEVLSFSIATGDTTDLKAAAQIIKENWEKLGAKVEIKIFDLSDLKQNVIRPRKYDALLFGTIIGRDLDFFPFWHSSQRNDPGLNIALYTNFTVDKILEEMRREVDPVVRAEHYREFETLIATDTPAIFAYSPEFIYIVPPKIKNINLNFLAAPSERFLNVHEWYIETNNIWKIFTP